MLTYVLGPVDDNHYAHKEGCTFFLYVQYRKNATCYLYIYIYMFYFSWNLKP